jgi:hypothetical protein
MFLISLVLLGKDLFQSLCLLLCNPPIAFQVPQAANSDPQPEHAPEWKERTVGFP